MQFKQRHAVEALVIDLKRGYIRFELRLLAVFVDGGDLVIDLDAERPLYYKHGENDADHSERIGCRIAARHRVDSLGRVDSLLRRRKTGGVGHRSRHHAHELIHRHVIACKIIDCKHNGNIERHAEHCKDVEPHASLLERREKRRPHLKSDCKDKQNESELSEEFYNVGVGRIAELT